MVSPWSIAAMIFTLAAAIFVPAILLAVLCAAKILSWRSAIAGFFFYALFQTCLRLPLLWLVYRAPGLEGLLYGAVGSACLMAFSAVLAEEGARLAGGKLLGRGGRRLSARDALGFGLGHCVAETFFVMGAASFTNLALAFALNNGGLAGYSQAFGQQAALEVYQTLTNTPPAQFAAGGLERAAYLLIQPGLTLLVFYGLRAGRKRYVALAAGLHFLLVLGVALMQPHGLWAGECYILLAAGLIFALCQPLLRRYWRPRGESEEKSPEQTGENP